MVSEQPLPEMAGALVGTILFDVSVRRLSEDHAAHARRVDAALKQFASEEK